MDDHNDDIDIPGRPQNVKEIVTNLEAIAERGPSPLAPPLGAPVFPMAHGVPSRSSVAVSLASRRERESWRYDGDSPTMPAAALLTIGSMTTIESEGEAPVLLTDLKPVGSQSLDFASARRARSQEVSYNKQETAIESTDNKTVQEEREAYAGRSRIAASQPRFSKVADMRGFTDDLTTNTTVSEFVERGDRMVPTLDYLERSVTPKIHKGDVVIDIESALVVRETAPERPGTLAKWLRRLSLKSSTSRSIKECQKVARCTQDVKSREVAIDLSISRMTSPDTGVISPSSLELLEEPEKDYQKLDDVDLDMRSDGAGRDERPSARRDIPNIPEGEAVPSGNLAIDFTSSGTLGANIIEKPNAIFSRGVAVHKPRSPNDKHRGEQEHGKQIHPQIEVQDHSALSAREIPLKHARSRVNLMKPYSSTAKPQSSDTFLLDSRESVAIHDGSHTDGEPETLIVSARETESPYSADGTARSFQVSVQGSKKKASLHLEGKILPAENRSDHHEFSIEVVPNLHKCERGQSFGSESPPLQLYMGPQMSTAGDRPIELYEARDKVNASVCLMRSAVTADEVDSQLGGVVVAGDRKQGQDNAAGQKTVSQTAMSEQNAVKSQTAADVLVHRDTADGPQDLPSAAHASEAPRPVADDIIPPPGRSEVRTGDKENIVRSSATADQNDPLAVAASFPGQRELEWNVQTPEKRGSEVLVEADHRRARSTKGLEGVDESSAAASKWNQDNLNMLPRHDRQEVTTAQRTAIKVDDFSTNISLITRAQAPQTDEVLPRKRQRTEDFSFEKEQDIQGPNEAELPLQRSDQQYSKHISIQMSPSRRDHINLPPQPDFADVSMDTHRQPYSRHHYESTNSPISGRVPELLRFTASSVVLEQGAQIEKKRPSQRPVESQEFTLINVSSSENVARRSRWEQAREEVNTISKHNLQKPCAEGFHDATSHKKFSPRKSITVQRINVSPHDDESFQSLTDEKKSRSYRPSKSLLHERTGLDWSEDSDGHVEAWRADFEDAQEASIASHRTRDYFYSVAPEEATSVQAYAVCSNDTFFTGDRGSIALDDSTETEFYDPQLSATMFPTQSPRGYGDRVSLSGIREAFHPNEYYQDTRSARSNSRERYAQRPAEQYILKVPSKSVMPYKCTQSKTLFSNIEQGGAMRDEALCNLRQSREEPSLPSTKTWEQLKIAHAPSGRLEWKSKRRLQFADTPDETFYVLRTELSSDSSGSGTYNTSELPGLYARHATAVPSRAPPGVTRVNVPADLPINDIVYTMGIRQVGSPEGIRTSATKEFKFQERPSADSEEYAFPGKRVVTCQRFDIATQTPFMQKTASHSDQPRRMRELTRLVMTSAEGRPQEYVLAEFSSSSAEAQIFRDTRTSCKRTHPFTAEESELSERNHGQGISKVARKVPLPPVRGTFAGESQVKTAIQDRLPLIKSRREIILPNREFCPTRYTGIRVIKRGTRKVLAQVDNVPAFCPADYSPRPVASFACKAQTTDVCRAEPPAVVPAGFTWRAESKECLGNANQSPTMSTFAWKTENREQKEVNTADDSKGMSFTWEKHNTETKRAVATQEVVAPGGFAQAGLPLSNVGGTMHVPPNTMNPSNVMGGFLWKSHSREQVQRVLPSDPTVGYCNVVQNPMGNVPPYISTAFPWGARNRQLPAQVRQEPINCFSMTVESRERFPSPRATTSFKPSEELHKTIKLKLKSRDGAKDSKHVQTEGREGCAQQRTSAINTARRRLCSTAVNTDVPKADMSTSTQERTFARKSTQAEITPEKWGPSRASLDVDRASNPQTQPYNPYAYNLAMNISNNQPLPSAQPFFQGQYSVQSYAAQPYQAYNQRAFPSQVCSPSQYPAQQPIAVQPISQAHVAAALQQPIARPCAALPCGARPAVVSPCRSVPCSPPPCHSRSSCSPPPCRSRSCSPPAHRVLRSRSCHQTACRSRPPSRSSHVRSQTCHSSYDSCYSEQSTQKSPKTRKTTHSTFHILRETPDDAGPQVAAEVPPSLGGTYKIGYIMSPSSNKLSPVLLPVDGKTDAPREVPLPEKEMPRRTKAVQVSSGDSNARTPSPKCHQSDWNNELFRADPRKYEKAVQIILPIMSSRDRSSDSHSSSDTDQKKRQMRENRKPKRERRHGSSTEDEGSATTESISSWQTAQRSGQHDIEVPVAAPESYYDSADDGSFLKTQIRIAMPSTKRRKVTSKTYIGKSASYDTAQSSAASSTSGQVRRNSSVGELKMDTHWEKSSDSPKSKLESAASSDAAKVPGTHQAVDKEREHHDAHLPLSRHRRPSDVKSEVADKKPSARKMSMGPEMQGKGLFDDTGEASDFPSTKKKSLHQENASKKDAPVHDHSVSPPEVKKPSKPPSRRMSVTPEMHSKTLAEATEKHSGSLNGHDKAPAHDDVLLPPKPPPPLPKKRSAAKVSDHKAEEKASDKHKDHTPPGYGPPPDLPTKHPDKGTKHGKHPGSQDSNSQADQSLEPKVGYPYVGRERTGTLPMDVDPSWVVRITQERKMTSRSQSSTPPSADSRQPSSGQEHYFADQYLPPPLPPSQLPAAHPQQQLPIAGPPHPQFPFSGSVHDYEERTSFEVVAPGRKDSGAQYGDPHTVPVSPAPRPAHARERTVSMLPQVPERSPPKPPPHPLHSAPVIPAHNVPRDDKKERKRSSQDSPIKKAEPKESNDKFESTKEEEVAGPSEAGSSVFTRILSWISPCGSNPQEALEAGVLSRPPSSSSLSPRPKPERHEAKKELDEHKKESDKSKKKLEKSNQDMDEQKKEQDKSSKKLHKPSKEQDKPKKDADKPKGEDKQSKELGKPKKDADKPKGQDKQSKELGKSKKDADKLKKKVDKSEGSEGSHKRDSSKSSSESLSASHKKAPESTTQRASPHSTGHVSTKRSEKTVPVKSRPELSEKPSAVPSREVSSQPPPTYGAPEEQYPAHNDQWQGYYEDGMHDMVQYGQTVTDVAAEYVHDVDTTTSYEQYGLAVTTQYGQQAMDNTAQHEQFGTNVTGQYGLDTAGQYEQYATNAADQYAQYGTNAGEQYDMHGTVTDDDEAQWTVRFLQERTRMSRGSRTPSAERQYSYHTMKGMAPQVSATSTPLPIKYAGKPDDWTGQCQKVKGARSRTPSPAPSLTSREVDEFGNSRWVFRLKDGKVNTTPTRVSRTPSVVSRDQQEDPDWVIRFQEGCQKVPEVAKSAGSTKSKSSTLRSVELDEDGKPRWVVRVVQGTEHEREPRTPSFTSQDLEKYGEPSWIVRYNQEKKGRCRGSRTPSATTSRASLDRREFASVAPTQIAPAPVPQLPSRAGSRTPSIRQGRDDYSDRSWAIRFNQERTGRGGSSWSPSVSSLSRQSLEPRFLPAGTSHPAGYPPVILGPSPVGQATFSQPPRSFPPRGLPPHGPPSREGRIAVPSDSGLGVHGGVSRGESTTPPYIRQRYDDYGNLAWIVRFNEESKKRHRSSRSPSGSTICMGEKQPFGFPPGEVPPMPAPRHEAPHIAESGVSKPAKSSFLDEHKEPSGPSLKDLTKKPKAGLKKPSEEVSRHFDEHDISSGPSLDDLDKKPKSGPKKPSKESLSIGVPSSEKGRGPGVAHIKQTAPMEDEGGISLGAKKPAKTSGESTPTKGRGIHMADAAPTKDGEKDETKHMMPLGDRKAKKSFGFGTPEAPSSVPSKGDDKKGGKTPHDQKKPEDEASGVSLKKGGSKLSGAGTPKKDVERGGGTASPGTKKLEGPPSPGTSTPKKGPKGKEPPEQGGLAGSTTPLDSKKHEKLSGSSTPKKGEEGSAAPPDSKKPGKSGSSTPTKGDKGSVAPPDSKKPGKSGSSTPTKGDKGSAAPPDSKKPGKSGSSTPTKGDKGSAAPPDSKKPGKSGSSSPKRSPKSSGLKFGAPSIHPISPPKSDAGKASPTSEGKPDGKKKRRASLAFGSESPSKSSDDEASKPKPAGGRRRASVVALPPLPPKITGPPGKDDKKDDKKGKKGKKKGGVVMMLPVVQMQTPKQAPDKKYGGAGEPLARKESILNFKCPTGQELLGYAILSSVLIAGLLVLVCVPKLRFYTGPNP
ncbi:uncharacterized protein LOC135396857 [Ornithodoros turicata]|uniref:uncharacterized protein LOC135396857 n=1 Tax=Ornithodoros turicata TaxID=34597 RepID=UPI00313A385B